MSGTLHLAQALSNRGRRGRKKDFRDAERLVKRLISQELILSFVPDAEQRLWRSITRTKYQMTRNKVRLQNQREALLEEAHIKLSSLVSDLLGASARRMLKALAEGETDPLKVCADSPSRSCLWRPAASKARANTTFEGDSSGSGCLLASEGTKSSRANKGLGQASNRQCTHAQQERRHE